MYIYIFFIKGFDELRNVVRFLSFQNDDDEEVHSDNLGKENFKDEKKSSVHDKEKVPKRLEVADVGSDSGRRRSVRRSSFRTKEKKKRLQRLASMPGEI
jgi:hypothetical protein